MSSEATVPTGAVTRCQWPDCPSHFRSVPKAPGWRKLSLSADLTLVLCPFHAQEHVPQLIGPPTAVKVTCQCHEMIAYPRMNASVALQDWRVHARSINGPDDRVTCSECLRDIEPREDGTPRKHNMLDKTRGVLLAGMCPGVGQPPRELVRR